ncbi:MAG: protein phosphatase 2C domain-containing protein [Nostocaceae cyanobacterium]|nr:protein phosphatase 2C domain-containing protein [Nostocaceae cyanobacterium]
MENDAAMLYCPNDLCQAANPITNKFCQQCRTRLWKRYLWAVADGCKLGKPGEYLGDRYLVIRDALVLDTKPSVQPENPVGEISQLIRPYLRLIPYRLHLPQAYGVVSLPMGKSSGEILLLEEAPIYGDGSDREGQLMPQLTDVGDSASSLRQINWLWQIACLWQPLQTEGVVSSLLDPQLLRQEGMTVRLLQLQPDQKPAPTLADLGKLWWDWLPWIKPAIAPFVEQVCQQLIGGQIHSSEQLITLLDRAATELGRQQTVKINIATKSDKGPQRSRNEDACYPPSGSKISKPPQSEALVIVCDGIGGHEGGNVASNLAIQTIQGLIKDLTKLPPEHLEPAIVLADLEAAVAAANDNISNANDKDHKQGRQRMGTTLVMGLAIAHEMYIAHVGDSRAYLITRHGCHQLTLDDDLASREVRLGYSTYRDAVQQISSGSLIQALGMNPSNALHPTSGRLIIDESCVILLTSDGLSDFDRVEQYWETEILPIIAGNIDLATATERLVEIANTLNGHDNVTVGLIHYQVESQEPATALPASIAVWEPTTTTSHAPRAVKNQDSQTSSAPSALTATQILPAKPKGRKLPLLLGLLLLLGLAGGIGTYIWKPELIPFKTVSLPSAREPLNPNIAAAPVVGQAQPAAVAVEPEPGYLIRSQGEITLREQDVPPNLAQPPGVTNNGIQGILPTNSVVLVINKQRISPEDYWLQVKVCDLGQIQALEQPTNNIQPLQPGQQGWIRWSAIQPRVANIWQPADTSLCPVITVKPLPPSTANSGSSPTPPVADSSTEAETR